MEILWFSETVFILVSFSKVCFGPKYCNITLVQYKTSYSCNGIIFSPNMVVLCLCHNLKCTDLWILPVMSDIPVPTPTS